ncbi:hypothetical protein CERSUDRAFT_92939 [Gelatoporia subvermispora B]|uniref:Uncharacterized protein n=1 Tax=Ceriporiopsis subvermispora (strain B) TaxID=914234 RepID=M2PQR2_CERS8|nr:hypothetical protein CERSUDRAFT_92939 [Gelatoporia subvermispora B]
MLTPPINVHITNMPLKELDTAPLASSQASSQNELVLSQEVSDCERPKISGAKPETRSNQPAAEDDSTESDPAIKLNASFAQSKVKETAVLAANSEVKAKSDKQPEPKDPKLAYLYIIGQICTNNFFMVPNGNWKPSLYTPTFNKLFEKHNSDDTKDVASDDSSVNDESSLDIDDELGPEFQIKNWPVSMPDTRDALLDLFDTYHVIPILVYGQDGHLIPLSQYHTALPGATVKAHSSLMHYFISDKGKKSWDTYSPDLYTMHIIKPAPVSLLMTPAKGRCCL